MSDYVLKIIPKTISYRASAETVERIVEYLRNQVPAMEVTARVSDEIEFVDCGGYMEKICCPHCGANLGRWWDEAMDKAWKTHFRKISVQTPCCQYPTTLNDLRYHAPCGFSCTEFDLLNPRTADKLDDACLQQIAHELGTDLQMIYARY